MFSWFTHRIRCISTSFIFFWQIIFHCVFIPHFIYPFIICWTFGLFLLFGYYKSCCYVYSCIGAYVDIYFIYLWVELLGHMLTLYFSLLRNCQTVFQSGCTILHSHQQFMRVPVFLHPHQNLLLSIFFYNLFCGLIYGLSWTMFHMNLWRKHSL